MNIKKVATVALATSMIFGMVACKNASAASETTGVPEILVEESGVIGGIKYTINECELQKYQINMLSKGGYYIDALEQDDSPEFVFISSGKKDTTGYGIYVQNIEIDDSNNVTITVFETEPAKGDETEKEKSYPAVVVEFEEFVASVKVVGVDGTEYAMASI